ncbi:unnamed protein product [Rotaria socialis]|uniref:Uncharacterized protein n=1 Tax=Rotaria socialis TaxID=392032 RepID=A0A817R6H5_9BILA|nr:unnamed protein product [Rotaria socialis]CAF3456440.1 unnamed protein product [Rotaria socialis]CAF3551813.1 unnamed protein product [Rotaria socialis]CAF3736614.1 unnamed protein product [Rotaria socialis]CAF4098896.1 unnamed protein product [Rotaria socialis]
MCSHNSNDLNFSKSDSSYVDAVALYGHNSTAYSLAKLFSSVGVHVYILSSNRNEIDSSSNNFTIINNQDDLPYLSSVLINCQNDLILIKNLINSFPNDYRQRMAYVECSSFMGHNQIELIYEETKFRYYLCMNLIELEISTMTRQHFHLISSGDKIVFQNLLLQTKIPAKITFLNQTKTPFDSYYICLLHRYSQAIHLVIYAEMMAILKAANPIYPANLQFLFNWCYIRRPLMRQIILQSSSSSFTFTTINDFQLLLECVIDHFYKTNLNETDNNHLKALTYKTYQFISNLDMKQKQKPLYELFTLY